eukprot:TRINITY_DN6871_c0_g1_i1.p1 TRINITY_DN6871_c0_g1~~TRINITY_DN6871_c0_g1_i1.p1  ORF type:complete len:506 (+),score=134.09 TRINITY_DN6871_c0_g1_i1:204-1721(+)
MGQTSCTVQKGEHVDALAEEKSRPPRRVSKVKRASKEYVENLESVVALRGAADMGRVGVRVLRRLLAAEPLDPKVRGNLQFVQASLEGMLLANGETLEAPTEEEEANNEPISPTSHLALSHRLDPEVRAYLAQMGIKMSSNGANKPVKRRFCHVAQAVLLGIRWRKLPKRSLLGQAGLQEAPLLNDWLMVHLATWTGFNVFELETLTGGHGALRTMAYAIINNLGLIGEFQLPKSKLETFFGAVEHSYQDNPYHNAIHAADVIHGAYILINSGFKKGLTELELLSIIVSAACHDAGHPGVTNEFRVASADELAITYNDRSVNENMSIALTYRLLNSVENNFLSGFTRKQKASMRQMVVSAVLATDMSQHFKSVKTLRSIVEEQGSDLQHWDNGEARQLQLEVILHAADLSNACRAHDVAVSWTDRVLEEFFAQGDRERSLGRDISPLCDRLTVSRPGSQIGFIDFIVRPMFSELASLSNCADALKNLDERHKFWAKELEKEKKKI